MSQDLIKLKENWESYVLRNEIVQDTRPCIREAWDRCMAANVDYTDGYGHVISDQELASRIKQREKLIMIAGPVMQNVFEIIKQTSFSLVLTDADGVIIYVIQSDNIRFKHSKLNFILGTKWDEKNVGANAIGTALAMNKDIHMIGSEHFCLSHHPWTCSAALIRDSIGNTIGCLDISGSVEDDHIHTFGIVTTAAAIIEKQLDLTVSYELMDTAFNSVLEGLFMLDRSLVPSHINDRVIEIFKMDRQAFKALDFRRIFDDVDIEKAVFENKENIRISDYSIQLENRKIDCLLNISPTKVSNHVTGAVVLIKEAKQVRKVVSQIVGFKAVYSFDDIITENLQMIKMIKFAKKISKTTATILIQGESGTGKELFAHAIHKASKRSEGPFIAINCAALPKDLVESELFGYEKGAFTGASKDGKPGKFELAHEGTIFLDEIGELPMEIQSKLLRVLENGKVNRIGSRYERALDVRIVTATNRDLRSEVKRKSFREDLFFRLNVLNIMIPPLRERGDDILLFADYFLDQFNKESDNINKRYTDNFLNSLLKNKWRGNVRELRYFLQREYFLSDSDVIGREPVVSESKIKSQYFSNQSIHEMEEKYIVEVLKSTNGNVIEASKQLEIGRSTIYRKIKEFDIDLKIYK